MDKNLAKLEQILNIVETDKITHEEFGIVLNEFVKVVEANKNYFESQIIDTKSEADGKIKEIAYALNELELGIKDLINNSEKNSLSKIKELSQRLSNEINRVEENIKIPKDYTSEIAYLDDLIQNLDKKIKNLPPPTTLDTAERIVDKINSLAPVPDLQIDAKHIKNLPKFNGTSSGSVSVIKQLIAGTGVTIDNSNISYPVISSTGGGAGYTVETPSGLVNNSNVTFTVTKAPDFIVIDGAVYFENAGFTLSGLTMTVVVQPAGYIRAFSKDTSITTNDWLIPVEPVDGNTFTFTVTKIPTDVVSDGTMLFDGYGYSYSSGQITLDNQPTQFIKYR